MRINRKQIKVEYEETYRDAIIKRERLPTLHHVNGGLVEYAELLKAGRLADGREFQELRVVIRPADEANR